MTWLPPFVRAGSVDRPALLRGPVAARSCRLARSIVPQPRDRIRCTRASWKKDLVIALVLTSSEVDVDEGGCSATRATARCVCTSPRIRLASKHIGDSATAAKQGPRAGRSPRRLAGDAVGCVRGEEQVPATSVGCTCFDIDARPPLGSVESERDPGGDRSRPALPDRSIVTL
jgi:hypothetical protein